jgi:hypothetical protein
MKIFVFGSNRAGRHGKGDALTACRQHGAIYGQGEGLQGRSYGIPTKNEYIQSLPLSEVVKGVDRFVAFAHAHPEMVFEIAAVGCRLAGFKPAEIAPLFRDAPNNCYFHAEFAEVLRGLGCPVHQAPAPDDTLLREPRQGTFLF